jgi:oligopeptidase B
MIRPTFTVFALLSAILTGATAAPTPPVAPRKDHSQLWHGRTFVDPYYWLREKDSPPVLSYLEAENRYTAAMTTDMQPMVDALYAEMLGRLKQTDLSVPTRRGKFQYYSRTTEGLQYPTYCRKPCRQDGALELDAREEVLLDQNALAKDSKFFSIAIMEVSDDGSKLLYSSDAVGFRQYKLYVKDLKTGSVQGPLAERVTSAAWAANNQSILYVTEDPVTKRANEVWRLSLGTSAQKVHEEKDELFTLEVGRTKDKQFISLASRSTDTWDQWLLSAADPQGEFKRVLPREKGHKYEAEHRDGVLYIRSNRGAKNFQLVRAPLANPAPEHWTSMVEDRPEVLLERVDLFREHVAVQEKEAGLNRLRIYSFAEGTWRSVAFPEPVYMAGLGDTPEFDSKLLRYVYQSFTTPPSVYDYDMVAGKSLLLKREGSAGRFRSLALCLRAALGSGARRRQSPHQHRLPEGLCARRAGAPPAAWLRCVRFRVGRPFQ